MKRNGGHLSLLGFISCPEVVSASRKGVVQAHSGASGRRMAAVDLSEGLLYTGPVCFYEDETKVESVVADYQADCYQVIRKDLLLQNRNLPAARPISFETYLFPELLKGSRTSCED